MDVDSAMPDRGVVASVQICPGHRKPMRQVQSVQAFKGVGLQGDIHALPESTRQILLIEKEILDALELRPGIVKENITTQGIQLTSLRAGQRLRVGNAVLQVTKPCKPCHRMDEIRSGLQAELQGRRGMLARVVEGGTISLGDPVELF